MILIMKAVSVVTVIELLNIVNECKNKISTDCNNIDMVLV